MSGLRLKNQILRSAEQWGRPPGVLQRRALFDLETCLSVWAERAHRHTFFSPERKIARSAKPAHHTSELLQKTLVPLAHFLYEESASERTFQAPQNAVECIAGAAMELPLNHEGACKPLLFVGRGKEAELD